MRRFFAAALAVVMLFGAVFLGGCDILSDFSDDIGDLANFTPSSKAETLERISKSERERSFSGYGYNSLKSEGLLELYGIFDDYINIPYSDDFSVDSEYSIKDVEEAFYAYRVDHPEVFWLSDTNDFAYYYSDDELVLQLTFCFENDDLIKAKTELEEAIDDIVSAAPDNATDYEIELYVNDVIVDGVEYDSNEDNPNRHNAYGALVDKTAVCDGYSKAFQILCNRLGVDCITVDGIAKDFRERTGGHMWNCVKLDDDWYHVDSTWNDVETEVYSLRYSYLNLTTGEISEDHEIGKLFSEISNDEYDEEGLYNNFVPYCESTDYNYFEHECTVLDDVEYGEDIIYSMAAASAQGKNSFDFIISGELDFDETLDLLAKEGYLYDWIDKANEINGHSPSISHDSKICGLGERRVVTMGIEYE